MSTQWCMSEDVQLSISFCRQTMDPTTGNKQKIDKLWDKIHADFLANWAVRADEVILSPEPRSQASINSRWSKLKPNLIFWGACMSYARRNPESGGNIQDEIRKAQIMYVGKMKKKFIHFECWEEVKNHPTFAPTQPIPQMNFVYEGSPVNDDTYVSETPEAFRSTEPIFSTPESNPRSSSSPVRPPGVKAAKEARRKGKKIATSNYNDALQTIADNQKRQLDIQQKQIELAQKQMEHTHKMQEKDANIRKLEEETRVMQMNTDLMTPKSKKYFSKRKAAILRQYDEDEDEDNNNGGDFRDEYFGDYYHPRAGD